MDNLTRDRIERIKKNIEKLDMIRDCIMEDFSPCLKGCNGLSVREIAYIQAAAEEFKAFYFEDALAALDHATIKVVR